MSWEGKCVIHMYVYVYMYIYIYIYIFIYRGRLGATKFHCGRKRDLLAYQKRPTNISKETYYILYTGVA